MSQEYRRPFEFSDGVRREALERAKNKCDHCGRKANKLERFNVHHIIAIWWALETHCLAPEVIKSICNASVLCATCHAETHRQESRAFYEEVAPMVLAAYLEKTIDHSKDSWREKLR